MLTQAARFERNEARRGYPAATIKRKAGTVQRPGLGRK